MALAVIFTLASCDEGVIPFKFDLSAGAAVFEVPPTMEVGTISATKSNIPSNITNALENAGQSADKITEIYVKSGTISLATDNNAFDFADISEVKMFVEAAGLDKKEVLSKDASAITGTTYSFDRTELEAQGVADVNLAEYLKKETVDYTVEITTTSEVTETVTVTVQVTYEVNGKI